MEQITLGKLTFEERKEDDEEVILVRRNDESKGYAEYRKCPDNVKEWNYLKKNCWPLNGVGEKPPAGKWVLHEYVGGDQSSGNLMPSKADGGFSARELMQLTVAVNAAFGDPDSAPLVVEMKPRRRRRPKEPEAAGER